MSFKDGLPKGREIGGAESPKSMVFKLSGHASDTLRLGTSLYAAIRHWIWVSNNNLGLLRFRESLLNYFPSLRLFEQPVPYSCSLPISHAAPMQCASSFSQFQLVNHFSTAIAQLNSFPLKLQPGAIGLPTKHQLRGSNGSAKSQAGRRKSHNTETNYCIGCRMRNGD